MISGVVDWAKNIEKIEFCRIVRKTLKINHFCSFTIRTLSKKVQNIQVNQGNKNSSCEIKEIDGKSEKNIAPISIKFISLIDII
jgi:hypothetical protein